MIKIFFFIIINLYCSIALGIESKIILKIDDEIVTNQDVIKEYSYLLILNKKLANLQKEKVLQIAKESIIKEKIKKIEIKKNFEIIKLDNDLEEGLFKNLYLRLGFDNESDFQIELDSKKISKFNMIDKITIEALWNRIIAIKYLPLVSIDTEKYKKEILIKKNQKTINYLLSEIVFEIKQKENIKTKTEEINGGINKFGFENTAVTYSISDTAKTGGKLDWISEKSMNKKILKEIKLIKKDEFTKPIKIPAGYLILKINNLREQKSEFNLENELDKKITFETNSQLDQYSNIYFNKIKKKMQINEN